MTPIRAAISIALVIITAALGYVFLEFLVRDPLTTLRAVGEFAAKTAPFWLAVLAWIARGLWEHERRNATFFDHTTTRRTPPRL